MKQVQFIIEVRQRERDVWVRYESDQSVFTEAIPAANQARALSLRGFAVRLLKRTITDEALDVTEVLGGA